MVPPEEWASWAPGDDAAAEGVEGMSGVPRNEADHPRRMRTYPPQPLSLTTLRTRPPGPKKDAHTPYTGNSHKYLTPLRFYQ